MGENQFPARFLSTPDVGKMTGIQENGKSEIKIMVKLNQLYELWFSSVKQTNFNFFEKGGNVEQTLRVEQLGLRKWQELELGPLPELFHLFLCMWIIFLCCPRLLAEHSHPTLKITCYISSYPLKLTTTSPWRRYDWFSLGQVGSVQPQLMPGRQNCVIKIWLPRAQG